MMAQSKVKRPVSKTKLSQKRASGSKRTWLLAGLVAFLAVAVGVTYTHYSKASSCQYAYCWVPSQFSDATTGSIVDKGNGLPYWNSGKDSNLRFYVASSTTVDSWYCVNGQSNGSYFHGSMYYELNGSSSSSTDMKNVNGAVKGCLFVPKMSAGQSGRKIWFNANPGAAASDVDIIIFSLFRSTTKPSGY